MLRIDFRPASRIAAPDVSGSIYLDAERYVIRRAVVHMTQPEAAKPGVLGLTVTTTFRELVPLIPVFDSIETDQPLPFIMIPSVGMVHCQVVENDRILSYAFENRTPGEQGVSGSPPPAGAASVASAPQRASAGAAGIAAPPRPVAPLVGRVIQSDGTPVVGAAVGLFGTRDTTSTSDSGRFALGAAPSGAHMLWVRRLGFEPARVPVTISSNRSHTVTVTLVRSVPVLPTVLATGQTPAYHDVGLDRRMRAGQGQFLTYDQIQRKHVTKLSQLLQGMRGIRVWLDPHNFSATVEGTRGLGSCVSYVVDGTPQTQLATKGVGGDPLPGDDADNMMDPSVIGAIEVYSSSERPLEFGAGLEERPLPIPGLPAPKVDFDAQQCVLVVIWTRARLGLPESDEKSAATTARTRTPASATFPTIPACEPPPAVDTSDVAIYATLESERYHTTSDTAWSNYVDQILTALRGAFIMPTDLSLPVFGYPFGEHARARGKAASRVTSPALDAAPTLSNVLVFTLDSSGAVEELGVVASSLSGPADTSLLAAITMAATTNTFPRAPSSERAQGAIQFDLIVRAGQPAVGDGVTVLGRVSVPTWPLTRRALLADGPLPSLAPDSAPPGMSADSATLEFVVDEQGRIAMSSVRAVTTSASASEAAFLTRVVRALPQMRFEPALVGPCPVRQIMMQGFAWRPPAGGQ